MPRSNELLLPRVPQWRCIYELKHCRGDILLRHSILQLRSVVIFDNFVARFFWFFRIIAYYYVINLIVLIILGFICVVLGARSVVFFCRGALCVEVPVTVLRVFLGNVTSFWSTFVLGGGGVM